ncbi:MAG TPA: ribonuclease III domain-containing protein, partial [Gammaproteobacteria bacterium]|nr:ribonuclease III domain-containing protein [Gammaproteobacteria bacterium]
ELYCKAALNKDVFSVNVLQEKGEFYKKLKAVSEQNVYYYSAHDSVQIKSAYLIAKLHYDDTFSQKNIAKSIEYYTKAAKHHHVLACNELGDIYYYGQGIEKNYPEAFKWFKHISDSSNANAFSYYSLGLMYHNELGVKKDLDQAISAYERAFAKGFSKASIQLGHIYRGKATESRKEAGSNSTYYAAKAIQYYKSNENDKDIQNYIGVVYYESNDYANARQWFEKSAKQGLPVAQSNVGLTFENGFKDIKNAILWYECAAKNGYANAQYTLALKYERGEGVPKDEMQAFEWCLKAAENNNEAAKAIFKKDDSFFCRYNKLYTAMNKRGVFKNNLGQLKKYIDFEKQLGYEFSNPDNLFNALDRREDTGSNGHKGTQEPYFQSYEFLGDAVLSATVRQYIVNNKPTDMKVGRMSNINDDMVKNKAILFETAKKLRLSEFIIKGEFEGSHDITNAMLSDHMEALIGAVSKDGSFEEAEKLVLRFWKPCLDVALQSPVQTTSIVSKQLEEKINPVRLVSGLATVPQIQKPFVLNLQSRIIPNFPAVPLSPRSQHLFIRCPLTQYVQYIKEARDINVNNFGKKGDTPIMTFLKNSGKKFNTKDLPIIEALYKAGASLEKPNKKGKTARQLIEENPYKEIIKSKLDLR